MTRKHAKNLSLKPELSHQDRVELEGNHGNLSGDTGRISIVNTKLSPW